MNPQDEVMQELRKKTRTLRWASMFFAVVTIVGILANSIFISIIGFIFVIGGSYAIRKFRDFAQNELADYVPGSGFGFFRKSREAKLKYMTYAQYAIVALILVCLWFRVGIGQALSYGVGGILIIEFLLKRRIALHTQIDDASLFELEELGIITSKDIVKALYKDFESWSQVRPGNKLLLVNQDVLICIVMDSATEASRMDIRLRDIKKLGVLGGGEQGEGLLVSIGTADNLVIRLKLEGDSFQDSPEEFFRYFLQALDKTLLASAIDAHEQGNRRGERAQSRTYDTQSRTDAASQTTAPATLTIRQLDFQEPISQQQATHHETVTAARHLDL